VSDIDAALEPVREFLARREAERRDGSSDSESLEKLQAAVAALQEPAPAPAASGADWDLYERNRAEIKKIVKRLRNGSH